MSAIVQGFLEIFEPENGLKVIKSDFLLKRKVNSGDSVEDMFLYIQSLI